MNGLRSGLELVDVSDVEKNFPDYLEKVEGALEVLDGLGLLVDRAVKIEVWSGGGSGAHGAYDPGGRLIRIFEDSVVAGYCEMTVCHEYGHHLSLGKGETEYEFMDKVRADERWSAWWKAVKATPGYKRLREAECNVKEPWSVRDYAAYLNDGREVFARCFSQWVGVRSGSAVLDIQHMGAYLNTGRVFGWSSEEFEAIAGCMDKMFNL